MVFSTVSMNDVSSNMIGLPDSGSTSSSFFTDFFESFNNGLTRFVTVLREGVSGIYVLINSIDETSLKIMNLTQNNSMSVAGGDLNLNNYIGNVRYVTGDLVFTEIYILLMIGVGFFFFQIIMKLFQVISYLVKTFTHVPVLSNAFHGFGEAFKSLFL